MKNATHRLISKPISLILLFAFFIVSCANIPSTTNNTHNYVQKFRTQFPFHIQTIALSEPKGGEITLIVSEPPPHITKQDLIENFPKLFKNYYEVQHEIGVDGFVTDVVSKTNISDGKFSDFLNQIGNLGDFLYGTSYKLPVVNLDKLDQLKQTVKPKLDLSVSSYELNKWLFANNTKLYILGGSGITNAREILNKNLPVSFISTTLTPDERISDSLGERINPGLVVWWIPKSESLEKWKIEARQFSLESDVLIGALANEHGTLLVARSRITPVHVYQPVRFETLSLLYNVEDRELAQSYDRTHPLISYLKDGSDWAPIYLSPILRDTEFGSLLNIADQLLKSWSNNGEVKYSNFVYQKPSKWAFNKPLGTIAINDMGFKDVTFNWNTKGYGFIQRIHNVDFYSLNRTGALPISYYPDKSIGDERIKELENIAYNYFSAQNDPIITKVSQYFSYYQIFRSLNKFNNKRVIVTKDKDSNLFKRKILEYILAAKNDSASKRKKILSEYLLHEYTVFLKKNDVYRGTDKTGEFNNKLKTAQGKKGVMNMLEEAVGKYITTSNYTLNKITANNFSTLISDTRTSYVTSLLYYDIMPILQSYIYHHNFPATYSRESRLNHKGWIHTPVIVFSAPTGSLASMSGGHNLNSDVNSFNTITDKTVENGHVIVHRTNAKNILIRSADGFVSNKLLHSVFRGETDSVTLNNIAKSKAPRSMKLSLIGDGSMQPPTPPGVGTLMNIGKEPIGKSWWGSHQAKTLSLLKDIKLHEPDTISLYISRAENGMVSVFKKPGEDTMQARPIEVASSIEAADIIASSIKSEYIAMKLQGNTSNHKVRLIFIDGFTNNEARGVELQARLKLNTEIRKDIDNKVFAHWFSKPSDVSSFSHSLSNKLSESGNSITIGKLNKITTDKSGFIETSLFIKMRTKSKHNVITDMDVTIEIQSSKPTAIENFKASLKSVVDRLKAWKADQNKNKTISDVLDGLDVELRKIEKSGKIELIKEIKYEAANMHIVINTEPTNSITSI